MTSRAVANVAALCVALATSVLAVAHDGAHRPNRFAPMKSESDPGLRFVTLSDGTRALVDHGGVAVPLRRFQRIVAGSTVADELLVALCERDRIAAFTAYHHGDDPAYAGKPTQPGLQNLEILLSLKPDLILTNHLGDPRQLGLLRERGLTVFDLGDMHGLSTLVPNVLAVATLLGKPERGEAFAHTLRRRLEHVASDVPEARRRVGLYVSVYGSQMFGGAAGTSYHDVLSFAGLRDAAGDKYKDWPAYTSEDLLSLDPELIVTGEGMTDSLCHVPGVDRLRACRAPQNVLELPSDLVGDPGPLLLEAAEMLHERAYPASAH